MRKDMLNVLVDPPKHGSWDKPGHDAKRFKLGDDLEVYDEFVGTKIPLKRATQRSKFSRINYSVMRRYLNRQVGRRWNDVFSEVCENDNKSNSTRIRDQVKWYIAIKVIIAPNGAIFEFDTHGIWEISTVWHHGSNLYVHPDTGIICRIEKKKKRFPVIRGEEVDTRKFGDLIYFEHVDRSTQPASKHFVYSDEKVWVRYDYIPVNSQDVYRVYNKDHTQFAESYPYETREISGKLYRLISKSASKKDIKTYGLNSPKA